MNLLQLQLITSVYQTMNFTRTAEIHHITQPAVSYQMRELENELQIELFVRNTRTVTFTDAGLEFVSYAQQICSLEEAAILRMKNIAAGQTGHLSIAYLNDQALYLSAYISGFSQEYPSVQIDTYALTGPQMMQSIRLEEYDIYFGSTNLYPESTSYLLIEGDNMPMKLFIPKLWTVDDKQPDWKYLKKRPFLSIGKDDATLYAKMQAVLKNHNCIPRIQYAYNRSESILINVNAGIGFSILPSEILSCYQFSDIVTFPLEDDVAEILTAIAFRQHSQNRVVPRFYEYVQNNIYLLQESDS